MPKKRVYKRDSKGRFAKTSSRKKARGKPTGKRGLPIVEVSKGGPRGSRKLQKSLRKEKAGDKVVNAFNYHSGGWTPRNGLGTYNLVARDPKSGKAIGAAVVDIRGRPAAGYGRSATIGQVFKGKTKRKGVGRSLISAASQVSKKSDLPGNPTEMTVQGMVPEARGFYNKTGAQMRSHSSMGTWSNKQRNKLAGKKVRVKRVR